MLKRIVLVLTVLGVCPNLNARTIDCNRQQCRSLGLNSTGQVQLFEVADTDSKFLAIQINGGRTFSIDVFEDGCPLDYPDCAPDRAGLISARFTVVKGYEVIEAQYDGNRARFSLCGTDFGEDFLAGPAVDLTRWPEGFLPDGATSFKITRAGNRIGLINGSGRLIESFYVPNLIEAGFALVRYPRGGVSEALVFRTTEGPKAVHPSYDDVLPLRVLPTGEVDLEAHFNCLAGR
ncbi:MAG: hypothetical protein AB7T49_11425 [Oligoflexales bacterium]